MSYEIIATNPDDGEVVASLTTKVNHASAHLLMGALGVYYETDDEEGSGDAYKFTDAELSAAEEALVLADGMLPPEEVKEGIAPAQVFLQDTRDWIKNAAKQQELGVDELQIEIGFF